MDLTQLANLGEFIGGLAVLVTLVYLAFQVRQGTKAERADANRSWTREWNRAFLSPLQEPEFANLIAGRVKPLAIFGVSERLVVHPIRGVAVSGALKILRRPWISSWVERVRCRPNRSLFTSVDFTSDA